jgi:hypothetical protein
MKHNNFPAFPFTSEVDDKKPNVLFNTGMSLRDYFAAAALTGLLAKGSSLGNAALWAYEAADNMLEQRNKNDI